MKFGDHKQIAWDLLISFISFTHFWNVTVNHYTNVYLTKEFMSNTPGDKYRELHLGADIS
jgi:hypothetical protein